MWGIRRVLKTVSVLLIATIGPASAQLTTPGGNAKKESFAQTENAPVTNRVKTWTRARLATAKKRWAQNQDQFAACSKRLAEQEKINRPSLHERGHILQRCMNRQ